MTLIRVVVCSLFLAGAAGAATLPGFRIEEVAAVAEGRFATSLAVDSRGTLYYTTKDGGLFRADGTILTTVPTFGEGNAGLLGMALLDDDTAVVHYSNAILTRHVVSTIDLATGEETVLHELVCDISAPERPAPTEHHGGNPAVAPDGTIYFGIGDFGGGIIAALPQWNGGKIFRITPDGKLTQFARGLRNPYDMAWDPEAGRLFVADNGAMQGDEIHIIDEGAYCGWPFTYGNQPPIEGGAVKPDHIWPDTTAPTGIARLNGAGEYFPRGFLVGAFITGAIYYFPDTRTLPLAAPIALFQDDELHVIDVAQDADGAIYFTTGLGIYRLVPPARGDCNGDGAIDVDDILDLLREVSDGDPHPMLAAEHGAFAGTWGCDVNADGLISMNDVNALARLIGRHRAVRRR
jgi:glucose/arabinose dehydrogenase